MCHVDWDVVCLVRVKEGIMVELALQESPLMNPGSDLLDQRLVKPVGGHNTIGKKGRFSRWPDHDYLVRVDGRLVVLHWHFYNQFILIFKICCTSPHLMFCPITTINSNTQKQLMEIHSITCLVLTVSLQSEIIIN